MLGGILQLEAIKTILLIPARNKKKNLCYHLWETLDLITFYQLK